VLSSKSSAKDCSLKEEWWINEEKAKLDSATIIEGNDIVSTIGDRVKV
jgi:hypothetical protein